MATDSSSLAAVDPEFQKEIEALAKERADALAIHLAKELDKSVDPMIRAERAEARLAQSDPMAALTSAMARTTVNDDAAAVPVAPSTIPVAGEPVVSP